MSPPELAVIDGVQDRTAISGGKDLREPTKQGPSGGDAGGPYSFLKGGIMVNFAKRTAFAGAVIEAVTGVAEAPGMNDVVGMEGLSAAPVFESTQTDEQTGALDKAPDVPAGGYRPFKGTAVLKGAGVGAGTVPAWGVWLQACAMAVTKLAADRTGTVSAVTTTTATLSGGVGVPAVGMPITIAGARRVITAAAGDNITFYPPITPAPATGAAFTIRAGNVFRPISDNLKTITARRWRPSDGTKVKVDTAPGTAGTFSLELPVRSPGRISFDMKGILLPDTEIDGPLVPVYQSVQPLPFQDAVVYFGGNLTNISKAEFGWNATVELGDNPLQVNGYDPASVTDRNLEIKISPRLALASERDEYSVWVSRQARDLWINYGKVVGNDISIYCPALVSKVGPEETDIKGVMYEGLTLQATRPNAGFYLWVG